MLYTSGVLATSSGISLSLDQFNGPSVPVGASSIFMGSGRNPTPIAGEFASHSILPGLEAVSISGRPADGLSPVPTHAQIVMLLTPADEMIESLLTAA